MSEDFVMGLSGREIIEDVLSQIRKALQRDCNLRESDSYGRGYSGKITVHLECFAIDTAMIEATVDLKPTHQLLKEAPETPQDADGHDVMVDTEIDIPVSANVDAVRKRSEQSVPVMTTEADGTPTVRRRSYASPVVSSAIDENAS